MATVRARTSWARGHSAPPLFRSHTHTHTHPHARTHTHTHTHAHTNTSRYGLHGQAPNPPSGTTGIRNLVAGTRYPIRIRFFDYTGTQLLQLYWRQGGTSNAWTPVPFSAFYAVPTNPPTYASVRTLGYPEPRVSPR